MLNDQQTVAVISEYMTIYQLLYKRCVMSTGRGIFDAHSSKICEPIARFETQI